MLDAVRADRWCDSVSDLLRYAAVKTRPRRPPSWAATAHPPRKPRHVCAILGYSRLDPQARAKDASLWRQYLLCRGPLGRRHVDPARLRHRRGVPRLGADAERAEAAARASADQPHPL